MSDQGNVSPLLSLKNEVAVARSELKNIRKEINTLRTVHKKEVAQLENVLKSRSSPATEEEKYTKSRTENGLSAFDSNGLLNCKPIGFLKSVFQSKNGTPRQPSVCPHARGTLTIDKSVFTNPEHSLEGLSEFSHLWIIFGFHQNNNSFTKAKVKPPRLNGAKVGLFSTRSPYRPNPLGLTLAKIEKIEGATIHLSSIDIVDETPVFDIKPYIPEYDSPDTPEDDPESLLNESQISVGDADLSVIESEVQEVLESSNLSINTESTESLPSKSPRAFKTPPSRNHSLYKAFSELSLNSNGDNSEMNRHCDVSSYCHIGDRLDKNCTLEHHVSIDHIPLGTPNPGGAGNSPFNLNRSLEIVKDALCESLVSDLNESSNDPLDPLQIIDSVKKQMKSGKVPSPGGYSERSRSTLPDDSGFCNGSPNLTSGRYDFASRNPGSSPGSSGSVGFAFGSTSAVRHSISSVSDCDRSEGNDALYKLRRPGILSHKPDLVFGKPSSQFSPGGLSQTSDHVSVSSIQSSSDDTLCSYDDAYLSQSTDSILANQKVTLDRSFRSISPQLRGAGISPGPVAKTKEPVRTSPAQKDPKHMSPAQDPKLTSPAQKKTPISNPMSPIDATGHSRRMSPKLQRLYSNLVNSMQNLETGEQADQEENKSPEKSEIDEPTVANWISDASKKELLVGFTQRAEKMIQMFGKENKPGPFQLKHLESWQDLKRSVESVLKADPRSVYRRNNCTDRLYYFTVDCAHITCWFDGNFAEVLKVQPSEFVQKS